MAQKSLESLAIYYVGRYATTRHKLKVYLERKIKERGWGEEEPADIEGLITRFVDWGYIDDALFAKNKAEALVARGYGKRRIEQALYQAGIAEEDSRALLQHNEDDDRQAAYIYARKKKIGPFATREYDQETLRKQLQAFLRAGHDFNLASEIVYCDRDEAISAYPDNFYENE